MLQTITFNNYLLKTLKEQLSKMADAGNIEAPESSSLSPVLLQEQFENFGLSDSN